jgi:hypothetical protein
VTILRLGIVAALIVMCAGCAGGQREADSRAAAADFLAAITDRDTRKACALLATDTRDQLSYAEGEPCTTALGSSDLAGGSVDSVAVWGERAEVHASSGTLFLVELDTGWRIAAAGCTRGSDGTYDCRLGA